MTDEQSNTLTLNAQGTDARLSALETRMASLETLLRGRKQLWTYAGWAVAAAGYALSKGGDATAMMKVFLEVMATAAPGG